jgi:hypothetical protein
MDIVKNVIYGSLLGDASISKDKTTFKFKVAHSEKQLEYVKWKAKILGTKKLFNRKSGYGSNIFGINYYNLELLDEVYNNCIKNNRKTVTNEWLMNLDELALAIWYQDDGSWSKCGNLRNGENQQRRSSFSVCGFDENSVTLLSNWLKSKFGLKSRLVLRKSKYWMLELYHTSTIKLWKIVAPYLVIKTKIDLKGLKIKSGRKSWVNIQEIGEIARFLEKNFKHPIKKRVLRPNKHSKACRFLELNGKVHSIKEWAQITGLKRHVITKRLKQRLPMEVVLAKNVIDYE